MAEPVRNTVPSRNELISSLLQTRARLEQEGVITPKAPANENVAPANDNMADAPAAIAVASTEQQTAENAAPAASPEAAASTETVAAPDALNHPEVQKGLEQLLSEWDLFKSSGLFGLGAGGVEHPTYKQLAGLPTMAVISGRFEGADQKVVDEIKSYMEGWEQEHGIVADPEESFEVYLRRVIARILKIG